MCTQQKSDKPVGHSMDGQELNVYVTNTYCVNTKTTLLVNATFYPSHFILTNRPYIYEYNVSIFIMSVQLVFSNTYIIWFFRSAEDLSTIKACWDSCRSWWPKFHFNKHMLVDKDARFGINFYKTVVAGLLCGSGEFFEYQL